MSPDLLPFQPNRRGDFEAAGKPLLPDQMDAQTLKINNSLSHHMQLLRRCAQSSSRWHLVAILTAALIALVMAGAFSR